MRFSLTLNGFNLFSTVAKHKFSLHKSESDSQILDMQKCCSKSGYNAQSVRLGTRARNHLYCSFGLVKWQILKK